MMLPKREEPYECEDNEFQECESEDGDDETTSRDRDVVDTLVEEKFDLIIPMK